MESSKVATLGLALSGGGSRAAAFHRGTLQALLDLELVDRVDVVSTVSGGSVFGGAWLLARAQGQTDAEFLARMRDELQRGFIRRTIRPRLLKVLIPKFPYSRTDAIADTFDEVLFAGRGLAALPERPQLCINTAVMNDGSVGKFTREGFSAWGLHLPGASPSHQVPLPDFRLALAVAASAAFPIGLPPVHLSRDLFPAELELRGGLADARRISLTDGGVLENLGVQTLLDSGRLQTWDLVVSDAGTAEDTWESGSPMQRLRGFLIWLVSGRIVERTMLMMNNKQNRWARHHVVSELQSSWFAHLLEQAGAQPGPGLRLLLREQQRLPRRKVLFVRVNQTWSRFIGALPAYRIAELAVAHGALSETADADAVDRRLTKAGYDMSGPAPRVRDVGALERFLAEIGVDLSRAADYYERLGKDEGAAAMNEVATSFSGLRPELVDGLAHHAAWQVHASYATYGL